MKLIVAFDTKNGIGKDNTIPWFIKSELSYFKKVTTYTNDPLLKNVVIMGRKTWDSLPKKPLPNRINVVLTRSDTIYEDAFSYNSLDEALCEVNNMDMVNKENIFVIGGSEIYNEAIKRDDCEKIYATEVYDKYDCDKFFPKINDNYELTDVSKFQEENGIYYRKIVYTNRDFYGKAFRNDFVWKNTEECKYIETLNELVSSGIENGDRTGTGTYSVFGKMFKYDLSDTFPMLTTRRQFFRGIFQELMFYLSGKTSNKILQENNVNIWDGNTSREFLDNAGLSNYPEGDLGETYGFNFRHYGATYKTCDDDYTGQGYDQLDNVIQLLKSNPNSRRIIIDLWNCSTLHKAALPPCLCKYQFYVNTLENKLDLMIYIRSSDFFLANNWNVCTGALLVHLLCNIEGIDYTPGILTVITGNTHLYTNHKEQAIENISRTPRPFPKVVVLNKKKDINEFTYEDLKLVGYSPYPSIKASMAV